MRAKLWVTELAPGDEGTFVRCRIVVIDDHGNEVGATDEIALDGVLPPGTNGYYTSEFEVK
jgi:hypothetical protein